MILHCLYNHFQYKLITFNFILYNYLCFLSIFIYHSVIINVVIVVSMWYHSTHSITNRNLHLLLLIIWRRFIIRSMIWKRNYEIRKFAHSTSEEVHLVSSVVKRWSRSSTISHQYETSNISKNSVLRSIQSQ
jgi:hypothetical protein